MPLLYEALETELGGVQVYQTALRCALNEELKEEWQEYLEQTENHVQVLRGVFQKLNLDPEAETPGRQVVRHIGQSLVEAMEMALAAGNPDAAQLSQRSASWKPKRRTTSTGSFWHWSLRKQRAPKPE